MIGFFESGAKVLCALENRISSPEVAYITEGGRWSIYEDARNITKHLGNRKVRLCTTAVGLRNSIVHFGSVNTLLGPEGWNFPHPSNKLILTWFHVVESKGLREKVLPALTRVSVWHTSCEITRNQLLSLGVPSGKILKIPLGVDLSLFSQRAPSEKDQIRARLGIPLNRFVIGSFQKDGNGWGEGLEPKLIKGPDVLCDVLEKIDPSQVFVLLTGPSRGYVKKRLSAAGVPFIHQHVSRIEDLPEIFGAVDACIVTSRVEGGPKAILEAMATGVPVVSSRVGMAPEVIRSGENGFLVDVGDVQGTVAAVQSLLASRELRISLANAALEDIAAYDWRIVAKSYSDLYIRP